MIWLHVTITALLGFGWSFLGGHGGLLTTLIMFTVLDYLSGVMVGTVQKNLSSAIGFKGIFQKIMMFVLIGVAHVVDEQILGTGNVLRSVTVCFYASNEGISILENATLLGLPVPSKLKEVLENLNEQEEMEKESPSPEVEEDAISQERAEVSSEEEIKTPLTEEKSIKEVQ